ncbi:MAG: inositol monophosphatase [Deltaproteobacteria bacterium]|nr:inositol monophosphatase [Deltaproteobacteria bacterium]
MTDFKEFTITMAREAGALLKNKFHEAHTIEYKGEIDIVTEADKMSEDLLITKINQRYPSHAILSEETGAIKKESEYRWIIDPLDGTTNYSHRYPIFCVSIALELKGNIILGVIYNPMSEELFVAEKGAGSFLNGGKLSVSKTTDLSKCMLATGFPYDVRYNKNNNLNYFAAMIKNAQAVRRPGSAALDLAYVAAGCFDGFWELKLNPWDTAAGWLMVTEAGGTVTDLFGASYRFDTPHILASNGLIHEDMISIIKETRS